MSSFLDRFLRRVRIHDGECGAVARALHHEVKFFASPAVFENVSSTTKERNQMSKSTNFKRIALALVVSLSFGFLGSSQASAGTIIGETLTVAGSSTLATSSITQGETATVSVVTSFTPEAVLDSMLVTTSCAAPSGGTCPAGTSATNGLTFSWTATTDSTSVTSVTKDGSGASFVPNKADSFLVVTSTAAQAVRFTATLKFQASATQGVGKYTITVYTKSSNAGAAPAVTATNKSVTWEVTVAAQDTNVSGLNFYKQTTAARAEYYANTMATTKDSAITADAGKNAQTGVISYNAVAYVMANAKNAAGDTTTAASTNICSTACNITATVTNGPGLVMAANGSAKVKTTTFTTDNNSATGGATETLIVYSDGTAGVGTITFYNAAGVSLGSTTITFTGVPASATSVSLTDTLVAISASTNTYIKGYIKDAGGSVLTTSGTIYVFTSDSNVVRAGAMSTASAQYTQLATGLKPAYTSHACDYSNYSSTTGQWSCALTVGDTGTATVYFADSWTVAASSWTSSSLTLTGLGTTAASYTVAFDKSSYNAGEQALITITGKDLAGRAVAGTQTITQTASLGFGNGGKSLSTSTNGSRDVADTQFIGFNNLGSETGIETRVVVMPATSGTLTYTLKFTPASTVTSPDPITVTTSVTVTDPAEIAANAATAAAKAAQAAAVEAADAATDAALQAIDAANAATDAANLAAEAADAATVAAEEAKDAADAATAAVEALATQVATLMAALQAQIRSLSNTVAKIAKKVKA
jgi:trimeric autotransporter adhesin